MAGAKKNFFVGGMIAGAIVAPIVLFSAGWIVTSGAADAAAKETANAAVVASLTPICVSQFESDAKSEEQLERLKKLSQWDRADYVRKNGWATMPGSTSANDLVASECARRLAVIEN